MFKEPSNSPFSSGSSLSFAEPFEITLADGSLKPIKAIYDDPFTQQQIGEHVADATEPELYVFGKDMAGLRRGLLCKRVETGELFKLKESQPDGTGNFIFQLSNE